MQMSLIYIASKGTEMSRAGDLLGLAGIRETVGTNCTKTHQMSRRCGRQPLQLQIVESLRIMKS